MSNDDPNRGSHAVASAFVVLVPGMRRAAHVIGSLVSLPDADVDAFLARVEGWANVYDDGRSIRDQAGLPMHGTWASEEALCTLPGLLLACAMARMMMSDPQGGQQIVEAIEREITWVQERAAVWRGPPRLAPDASEPSAPEPKPPLAEVKTMHRKATDAELIGDLERILGERKPTGPQRVRMIQWLGHRSNELSRQDRDPTRLVVVGEPVDMGASPMPPGPFGPRGRPPMPPFHGPFQPPHGPHGPGCTCPPDGDDPQPA